MILTLISLAVFVTYMVYAIRVAKGIPWSISETYYHLEQHGRPKYLFQLTMIFSAFLLLPSWLKLSPEHLQFLTFLSCAGLIFVGAAPCFKLRLDGRIHYVATVICGISSVIWICLMGFWFIPLSLFLLAIYLTYRYLRPLFWIECTAFISAYTAIIIQTCVGS